MDIQYKNRIRNRYYNYPLVSTYYAKSPEPILQKTKYVATEIQPMDMHQRNNNIYYT